MALNWPDPEPGFNVHFNRLQHQQNTAVHKRPRNREKGQETSGCVFQLMYLVCLQLRVSIHLSVCAHLFDDLRYKYMRWPLSISADLGLIEERHQWKCPSIVGIQASCPVLSANREQ